MILKVQTIYGPPSYFPELGWTVFISAIGDAGLFNTTASFPTQSEAENLKPGDEVDV